MRIHTILAVIVATIVLSRPLAAQTASGTPAVDHCAQVRDNIADKIRLGIYNVPQSRTAFSSATDPSNITDFTRCYVAMRVAGAVSDSQLGKTEHQAGATAASSGSSSLSQKGAVSKILSFAVDNGGLQQEVSGTSVTFRGNPVGLLEVVKQKDMLGVLAAVDSDSMKTFLSRFSFAATFDTNRGGVQNTLLANSKQLQGWSGRYEIVNERDAHRLQYAGLWRAVSDSNAASTGGAELQLLKKFEAWPEWAEWRNTLDKKGAEYNAKYLADATYTRDPVKLNALINEYFEAIKPIMDQLPKLANPPKNLDPALDKVLSSWKKLDADSNKVMDYVQKGTLLTFDWTTKRDPALPDLYSNTVVYEMSPWKGRLHDFTLNAGINWYRLPPTSSSTNGRLKDANAVAQYDIPLGDSTSIGKFILTFAGKYQFVSDSVVNVTNQTAASTSATTPPVLGGLVPTIKGHLGAFQMKLSIPGGKSGIRIPIAFTAATRSEIFNKPDYRALVGLSFDFDSLFTKGAN